MNQKRKLTPLEKWERLSFADNFIFCKVMETDPEICREMLELLLNIKIERIEFSQAERTMKTDFDSKGIRLDVFVKDGTGRCFDIEIQTSTAKRLALAKRARYYQGLMDVDSIFSGEKYQNLKETYVIFLCLGDVFGKGLPVYTFQDCCKEDPSITMEDGAYKIFFNAKKYDTMKSEELKSFFKYLCGKQPDTDFTDRISAIVSRVKMNARWRHEYMTWEQEMELRVQLAVEDRIAEAVEDAAEDRAIETAQRMFAENISPEVISRCTNLPLKQVLELQKEAQTVKS